jgi:molybdenum cofactor synthesis domain-containing protein
MVVTIITVSDRASAGVYEDLAGAEIEKILLKRFPDAVIRRLQVPDRRRKIRAALRKAFRGTTRDTARDSAGEARGSNFILTTGGTGISPRDITPEVTRRFCDREIPGIAEMLRAESYRETPNAMLSRGFAGLCGKTVVVNFPGSVKAATLCTTVLARVMTHALSMVKGEGH